MDLALGGKELGLGALGDTLSVLLNAGDGTFNSRADYATTVTSLASLDIDGDGDTDLAVATGNQAVQLLKNRGDGTFDPDAALPLEGRAWQVVADDLDADGDADLLVATSLPGQMVVFLNREGILSPVGAVTGPMGLIATGKLDGDPLPDVVMTHTRTGCRF